MDLREIKGRQLAATARLQRKGDRWYVPARHGNSTGVGGFYVVDPNILKPAMYLRRSHNKRQEVQADLGD